MGKNTLRFIVLFGAEAFLLHLLGRSPLQGNEIVLTYLTAFLPLLAGGAGLLAFNPSMRTAERGAKLLLGAIVAGFVYVALVFNGSTVLNQVYNTRPEGVVWAARAVFDWLCVLVPALLMLALVQYAFFRAKPFRARSVLMLLLVFSLAAVVLSVLSEVCAVRLMPSVIVGDFGLEAGGDFLWLLEELQPLLLPALLLCLCLEADGRITD